VCWLFIGFVHLFICHSVFYKPYESQGQAWPLTFVRLIWGVIIFLVFMTGIFILKQAYVMSTVLAPLLVGTILWSWYVDKTLKPLSTFVSLSSVFEVERGEETADVVRLREGHPVTWSQSNLSKRRYAQNDDTLYVAPEDERTDYSQPPMANWYNGVLNTGKRRYGHPALNGVLPEPWLPLKKGQTLVNHNRVGVAKTNNYSSQAVVLTLRNRYSITKRNTRQFTAGSRNSPGSGDYTVDVSSDPTTSNPWEDAQPNTLRRSPTAPDHLNHRLSFDQASGVIMLPDDSDWLIDVDSDEEDYGETALEAPQAGATVSGDVLSSPTSSAVSNSPAKRRYGTYYHHPERRRSVIPGAFPML